MKNQLKSLYVFALFTMMFIASLISNGQIIDLGNDINYS